MFAIRKLKRWFIWNFNYWLFLKQLKQKGPLCRDRLLYILQRNRTQTKLKYLLMNSTVKSIVGVGCLKFATTYSSSSSLYLQRLFNHCHYHCYFNFTMFSLFTYIGKYKQTYIWKYKIFMKSTAKRISLIQNLQSVSLSPSVVNFSHLPPAR